MHVDHNMHVIGCNMHVTCTLFRIGVPSMGAHMSGAGMYMAWAGDMDMRQT